MNKVYLLLGSNLGNRQLFLQQAVQYIAGKGIKVLKQSAIYETESWGNTDLPSYLNQVIEAETVLQPIPLLQELLQIELLLGRKREEKWGSRTMDIDILFYGEQIINKPELIVPHPELHNRRFTLEPLAEIAPYFVHPVLKQNILTLKGNLTDTLKVKKYIFDNY